jgi:hypothetical protein
MFIYEIGLPISFLEISSISIPGLKASNGEGKPDQALPSWTNELGLSIAYRVILATFRLKLLHSRAEQ